MPCHASGMSCVFEEMNRGLGGRGGSVGWRVFTARGHAKTGWRQRVAGSEGGRLCCSLGIVI